MFIAVLAACAFALTAPAAHPSAAGPVPDTTGLLTPWRIEPANPCVIDSVFMIVRGFVATPCDSFLGAEAIDPLHVRIRTQVYMDRACFAAPFIFYPVPVALGRFPAGPQMGLVDVETIKIRQDGSTTTATQQFRFDFTVADSCPGAPLPPPELPPFVRSIGIDPEQPCNDRPTSLVVRGEFPDGCGRVVDSFVIDPGHVELTLKPYVLADTACTLAPVPWKVAFDLGVLPAGAHRTDITVVVLFPDSTGTGFEHRVYGSSHQFWVYGACDSVPPPPPPGTLPYVTNIEIGRGAACSPDDRRVCPGESLQVTIRGVFPHDCFSFRRIVLIPSPATVIPPPLPTVRIIVDDGGCLGRPCVLRDVPWSAHVMLPPRGPGADVLPVELAQVTCSDTFPPGQLYHVELAFDVAPSCPGPPPCMKADFQHASDACDTTITPTRPAELTFLVGPSVALAGLQGEFTLYPSVARVTKLEAIGPATGMLLSWTATPDGARFTLVAAHGAPIGPFDRICQNSNCPIGWPVLRVTVSATRPGGIPERTEVTADQLLGSDIDGQAVRLCTPLPCVDPPPPGRPAVICAEHACDFNADGLEDIRDLVLMVHCANHEGACPPDANVHFDCDGDSTLAIADVICCAREILGHLPCPGCPDSGTVRPEPRVSVSFGAPAESADGVALPVRFNGCDRLGAAMLTLDLPLERYEVTGFDGAQAPNWLALHDEQGGRVVLGLIGLGSNPPGVADHVTFMLRLRLRPGASPGGIVTATAGEFSGPDGVSLAVSLGQPSQALPGDAGVVLSANQPNPFSRETAFTLQVAQAGEVAVMIFDLRGRAVATLHRAPLEAGPHVFRWDGRQTDGSAAPNGIYFYQATVAGQSLARKLILMRGN